MKTMALFLTLCFFPSPPVFALRGSVEGVQVGVEEKLLSKSQSLDPSMGRVLFDRVDRILHGNDPESEFLWPAEARRLQKFHWGQTFWLKKGKSYSKVTPRNYQRFRLVQKAVETAEKRARAYAGGVRTLETLPRQARLMLVYGAVGTGFNHPKVDETLLRKFLRKHWDSENGGISSETRSALQKDFQSIGAGLLFLLEGQRFGEKGIEVLYGNAFNEIEAVFKSRKYAGLRREMEMNGQAVFETEGTERLLELRERWREISVQMVDTLIRFAPLGEKQEIGLGTPIGISDQAGPKERRIHKEDRDATLSRLRARLQGDPKGLLVKRLKSGRFLFNILNKGFTRNTLTPGNRGKTILSLEKAIRSVEDFLEKHRYAHLFPAGAQAGAEEKLITYPNLLRRRPLEEQFQLPGMIWPPPALLIRMPRKGVLLPWGYPELWEGIRVVNYEKKEQHLRLSIPSGWKPPKILLLIEKLKEGRTKISLGGDSAAGDSYSFNGVLVKVIPELGVVVRPYKTRDTIYIQRIETAAPVITTPPEDDSTQALHVLIAEQGLDLFQDPDKSRTLYHDPRGFEIIRSRLDGEWSMGTPPYTLTAVFPEGAWSLRVLQEMVPEILEWKKNHWLPTYSNPIRFAQEAPPLRVMISDFKHPGSLALSLESKSLKEMRIKGDSLIPLMAKVMVPVPEPLDSLLKYLKHLSFTEGKWALNLQVGTVLSLARRFYAAPAEREEAWKGLAAFLASPKHRSGSKEEWQARVLAAETLVNLSYSPELIRLALPILEVLADPKNGEEAILQEAGLWGKGVLSGRIAPRWFEPDALFVYYGAEVQEQVGWLAREVRADVAMLLPLNSREEEAFHIQPYFHGGEAAREQTRQYFEEANRQLASYGMEFTPLQNPPEPDQFERLGLLIYEKDLPKGTVPDGYRALSADRVDPGNPDRYEPVLVAASAIYPLLSLEFLRVRVKLAVVVEDSVTGARYLAILA